MKKELKLLAGTQALFATITDKRVPQLKKLLSPKTYPGFDKDKTLAHLDKTISALQAHKKKLKALKIKVKKPLDLSSLERSGLRTEKLSPGEKEFTSQTKPYSQKFMAQLETEIRGWQRIRDTTARIDSTNYTVFRNQVIRLLDKLAENYFLDDTLPQEVAALG